MNHLNHLFNRFTLLILVLTLPLLSACAAVNQAPEVATNFMVGEGQVISANAGATARGIFAAINGKTLTYIYQVKDLFVFVWPSQAGWMFTGTVPPSTEEAVVTFTSGGLQALKGIPVANVVGPKTLGEVLTAAGATKVTVEALPAALRGLTLEQITTSIVTRVPILVVLPSAQVDSWMSEEGVATYPEWYLEVLGLPDVNPNQ